MARFPVPHSKDENGAEQGARANATSCHASCWRRLRASRCRGSSLTFGKYIVIIKYFLGFRRSRDTWLIIRAIIESSVLSLAINLALLGIGRVVGWDLFAGQALRHRNSYSQFLL